MQAVSKTSRTSTGCLSTNMAFLPAGLKFKKRSNHGKNSVGLIAKFFDFSANTFFYYPHNFVFSLRLDSSVQWVYTDIFIAIEISGLQLYVFMPVLKFQ